jgi:hypothetical protein
MVNTKTRRASRRRGWRIAYALAGATALAGCSSGGLTSGGPGPGAAPAAPAPAPSADSSFSGRVKSFFTGSSGSSLPPAPPAGPAGVAAPAVDCPPVEFRQGAATLAVNSNNGESAALGLRYQGSFVQTARECQLRGGQLTIKVGVQGRVVVGPAGAPRDIMVPLRYALVREGQEQKTIWTKLFMVPVAIPDGQLNVPFIHVEEEMTVPNPSPAELDAYVIYIGFDPEGANPPKPKPAAKPKTARAR